MTRHEFWEKALLAGISAGRSLEQAEKQAEAATELWASKTGAKKAALLTETKAAPAPTVEEDAPAKKKRGRPPGSKNKPKDEETPPGTNEEESE